MPRVLVVDDEENIRFSYKRFLTDVGYEVSVAAHPIDARAILAANEFDVAIIDRILTDGQNGLDLIKHIRGAQPFCETILISAYPTFKSATETLKYEAFAYLTKPVKQEEVCQVVENAIRKSKTKRESKHYENIFQSLFDSSPNAIVICDLSGRVKFTNPSFSRIFGYEKEEVVGKRLPYMPGWDQKKTESEINDLKKGILVPERETRRLTKDDRIVDVAITQSLCSDSEGRPADLLTIIRDVTDKRKIEKQLRHAQKMEVFGILAGGIAHDFNNILMSMLGHIELAIIDMPEDNPARKKLEEALKSAKYAKGLTKQILTFSRHDEQELMPLQIHLIIKEALKLLGITIPNTIEIRQNINAKCGMILADPTRIHQLMMNLCINAYHSMRESGGVFEVSLQNVECGIRNSDLKDDENRLTIHLDPGPYIRLTVSDTGHGMDKDTMEHIFEPFFTTKKIDEGNGLGLSVAHGIVEELAGAITVESEPGKGSTFHVYFPRVEAAASEEEKTTKPVHGGKERILVVDDDRQVLGVVQQMLEYVGYNITARSSSLEALEIFCADPGRFDLLITDQFMPKMTGLQLAKKLMRIRPDIPIILITGLIEGISADDANKSGIREFIKKPFGSKELCAAVRRILDQ